MKIVRRRLRQARFNGQFHLDPERLFIAETWATTKTPPTYDRAPSGQRLRAGVPLGHWKATTFVTDLKRSGMITCFVLDSPINRDAFETYVERVFAPCLRSGDGVIMDLSGHK